eukprot:76198_1
MKYERKRMKIRICAQEKSNIDISKMIFNIKRVFLWWEQTNVKDFILVLDMEKINKNVASKYNKEKILNDLANMSPNVKTMSGNGLIFVITNKTCVQNGFGARCQFAPTWIKMNDQ